MDIVQIKAACARYKRVQEIRSQLQRLVDTANDEEKVAFADLNECQKMCTHTWVQTGEGRHGSNKGVKKYTCSICDDKYED